MTPLERAVYDRLTQKHGLSPAGAAAVMGNIRRESAWDPGAVGDNGASLGLFQHQGARRNELAIFSGGRSKNPMAQVDFAAHELGRDYPNLYRALRAGGDPGALAVRFSREFERPSPKYAANEVRAKAAREYASMVGAVGRDVMAGGSGEDRVGVVTADEMMEAIRRRKSQGALALPARDGNGQSGVVTADEMMEAIRRRKAASEAPQQPVAQPAAQQASQPPRYPTGLENGRGPRSLEARMITGETGGVDDRPVPTSIDRLRALAQGASFNLSDEVFALARTIYDRGKYDPAVYDAMLKEERAFRESLPGAERFGLELLGGLGAVSLAAKAMGIGASQVQSLGRAIAVGAGTGAAAGFAGGEGGVGNRIAEGAAGAAIGAGTTAAVSGAAALGGAIARRLQPRAQRTERAAAKQIAGAAERDLTTPQGYLQKADALAPDATLLDAPRADNLRSMMQGYDARPGPARVIMREFIEKRRAEMPDRLYKTIDKITNGRTNFAETKKSITDSITAVANQAYDAAFDAAPYLQDFAAAHKLFKESAILRKFMSAVREQSKFADAADVDVRFLSEVHHRLNAAIGKSSGAEKRALISEKEKLAALMPEEWRAVNAMFADERLVSDALENGRKFVSTGVDELPDVNLMSAAEQHAFLAGVAQGIRDTVEGKFGRRAAFNPKNFTDNPKSQEMLKKALGSPEKFAEFMKDMVREAEYMRTNGLFNYSATARLAGENNAVAEALKDPSVLAGLASNNYRWSIFKFIANVASKAFGKSTIDAETGAVLARWLTADTPEAKRAVIERVVDLTAKRSAAPVAAAIGAAAAPAMTGESAQ